MSLAFLAFSSTVVFAQTPPVTENISLSWGGLAGQILLWVLSITGPVVATVLAAALFRLFQHYGLQLEDTRKEQFEQHVINGINYAGSRLSSSLQLGMTPAVRSQLQSDVTRYVLDHGSDVIKAMGLSKDDPKLLQSIQARIEKALTDPSVPTPPVVTPESKQPDAVVSGTLKTTTGA